MKNNHALPVWAKRVPQWKIRRLYQDDAQGLYDEDLINEVGYALLARCQSFVTANEAVAGLATCPCCSAKIRHKVDKAEVLQCACGWSLSWGDYFKTIQRKQLSGAKPVIDLFQNYVDRFSLAKSRREQVFLIDHLIHGFHWYIKTNGPTRPVAINLIEGRLGEVIAFLDNLSYGGQSTPGVLENKALWDERIVVAKSWSTDK